MQSDGNNLDGVIQSDPNCPNSNLVFRSKGSVIVTLDRDENGDGLHPFVISNGTNQLFHINKDKGATVQRLTGN